jgi:hypothetical protein
MKTTLLVITWLCALRSCAAVAVRFESCFAVKV